jgi:hypothetical protein
MGNRSILRKLEVSPSLYLKIKRERGAFNLSLSLYIYKERDDYRSRVW